MSHFMIAMLNGGRFGNFVLLKPETVADMFSPHYQVDGRVRQIGITFFLRENYFGHRIAEHPGAVPGFTAEMMLAPDDRIGILVLANSAGQAPFQLAAGLARILFNYQEPAGRFEPDKKAWPKLVGYYFSPEPDFLTDARFLTNSDGAYRIMVENGKLRFGTLAPGESYELEQVNQSDPYFYRIVVAGSEIPQYLSLQPGASGRAEAMVIGLNRYVRWNTKKEKR